MEQEGTGGGVEGEGEGMGRRNLEPLPFSTATTYARRTYENGLVRVHLLHALQFSVRSTRTEV